MALRLLPDAEWAVTRWLRDHPDVPYSEISTQRPDPYPGLQVTRVGGTPVIPVHLDRARIDIDVWAADRQTAVDAARTAHAAIHEAGGQRVTGDSLSAVITNVADDRGFGWVPDPDPNTWHGVFTVSVDLHPTAS